MRSHPNRAGLTALTLLCLCAIAPAPAVARDDTPPVVEAERAFAKAAAEQGIGPAFRQFAAEDALLFAPQPQLAKPLLAAGGDPPGTLKWWPVYAGMAVSGDLGFTTGPFVADDKQKSYGWYFTVWRRQPDGSWRWIIDQAPPTQAAPPAEGADAKVRLLPASRLAPIEAQPAWAQVLREERKMASLLAADAPKAYAAYLAEDARVMRAGPPPASGRAAYAALLAGGPPTIETRTLGGAASGAGDLAFSYGEARWERQGRSTAGHYVRIWQRRAGGWKIVVDEIIPTPRPREAPPALAAQRK